MEINYELDFEILLRGAIEIGNSMHGKPNTASLKNLIYAEGLGQKLVHHCLAANHLYGGFQLVTDKHSFQPQVDFASIAILTRAALETYLTLNYLFVSSHDEDDFNFRFLAWDLAGYLERQEHIAKSAEHETKQQQEKIAIEVVKSKIQETSTFLNLNSKQKKRLLNGQWRLDYSWGDLAVEAGFNKSFFNQQYKFLCAYAHSSRLSIIQIQQTKDLNEQREMATASISVLMVVIAKFMYDYINLIPEVKTFAEDSEYYPVIMMWKTIGEDI